MAAIVIRLLLAGVLLCFIWSVTGQMNHQGKNRPKVETGKVKNKTDKHPPIRKHKKTGRRIPPPGMKLPSAEDSKTYPKHHNHGGRNRASVVIPARFDAREQWPQCTSLSHIRDQGQCGTCWAVSTAAVISDRMCIAGKQQDSLSGWQAAGCSNLPQTDANANCQSGGNSPRVYQRVALFGLNSGGDFQSSDGCVPYEVDPTQQQPQPIDCKSSCSNSGFSTDFDTDDTEHTIDSFWSSELSKTDIDTQVKLMQTDILQYGSISAAFQEWDDFSQTWKFVDDAGKPNPYDGPTPGAKSIGGHAIRLMGWDVTEDGKAYWIGANQWGTTWGDKGFFYITRGKNTVGIEEHISAPIVDASKTTPCSSATFCSQPIDQIVQMDNSDPSGPIYMFQGGCMMQVQVSDATLQKAGEAAPIVKSFVMGISPPITAWSLGDPSSSAPWLNAADGSGVSSCKLADGTKKYQCGSQYFQHTPSAFTAISSANGIRINNDGNINLEEPGGSSGYWPMDPPTFFSDAGIATVTALLKIDDKRMFVFGKGTSGGSQAGVVDYSAVAQGQGQFTWVTQPADPSTILAC